VADVCQNCKFARRDAEWEGDALLECHRYPPLLDEKDARIFPVVAADDWCGEWRLGVVIDMTPKPDA
jgi:hypothetical protein